MPEILLNRTTGSLPTVVLLVGDTTWFLVFEPEANVKEVFEVAATATRATMSIIVSGITFGVDKV